MEVIVAALVLMIIASAIALASVGGSKVRGASRVQTSLTAAGQQVQEDIIADRSWMEDVPACAQLDVDCHVEGYVTDESLRLQDIEGEARLVSATARALDSSVDRTGRLDEDGVIPDYYRLNVVLQLQPEVAARYELSVERSTRRFVTTIDRRGAEQMGSIAVEICRVGNQADERMNIQGCSNSGQSSVSMLNCERGTAGCVAGGFGVHGDCPPNPSPGCIPAFGWIDGRPAHATEPSPYVSMTRVAPGSVSFELVNESTGERTPSSRAQVVDGLYVFQNVPASEFRLVGLPRSIGANTERWRSKDLPSYHGSVGDPVARPTIAVDPGVRTKALVMYRPGTTSRGIDLYFERRTRTYTLRGPFTTREVSVPKMAPTHGYQGASAADYCENMQGSGSDESQHTTYDCVALRPTSQNCVTLYVEGTYYKNVGAGNGDTHYLYPDVITGAMGTGNLLKMHTNGPTAAMEFCTFYAEYLTHTYYGRVPPPRIAIRPGAAVSNTQRVEAMPDMRHVDYGAAGPSVSIPQCVVPARAQCTGAPALSRGLKPGLNTGVVFGSEAAAARNAFYSGIPRWLRGPFWVYPSGTIRSADGSTRPAGTRVTFTGLGECYWDGPRYSGEIEGSCNPCTPLWAPGYEIPGACSILTRTDWERPAWERITSIDWQGDGGESRPTTKPIQGQDGTIVFAPVWRCTSVVPVLARGSTCSAPPQGSVARYIPATRHVSPSNGGVGLVEQRSFGGGGVT